MTFTFRRLGALLLAVALVSGSVRTQDLGQQLAEMAKLGQSVAKGYVSPFASGLGNGMNTALYHSADLHGVLGFDVQLKIGAALVEDADKSFTISLPPSITVPYTTGGITAPATFNINTHYDPTIVSQTAVGEEDVTPLKSKVANTDGLGRPIPSGYEIFKFPGGTKFPVTGALAPQISVGLPFGLEVMARILPTMKLGESKASMTGFGLRYDVDQWLPLFPIDIAVHFASQKLNFKNADNADIMTASATAYGVEVSKSLLFLSVYGGFQLESSTVTVADIKFVPFNGGPEQTISGFEVEGSNKSRVTVGARMLLLFINIHAEYAMAETSMYGLGIGITFR